MASPGIRHLMVAPSGCGDEVSRQNRYLPTLDGWRAVAVIGVILFHGRSGFFAEDSLLYRICDHGILGVDVFFAISGFLICGLLLKEYEDDGDISLRRFYLRRCFRILPPYYVAMAIFCVVSLLGVITLNNADLPSCLLFYRNYMPLGTDERGGFYTAHFWTLAMEEHFYLIWPMLLLVVKPRRAGKVAFLLAMLVFCWRVVEGHFQLFLAAAGKPVDQDRHQDGRIIVGLCRGHLLSQDPARGWAYRLFAVVARAPGIAGCYAALACPGFDLVARDSATRAAGKHGHAAGKLVRAGFGMAADAMDWNAGLQSLYLAGAFSSRNRVGDGARKLSRAAAAAVEFAGAPAGGLSEPLPGRDPDEPCWTPVKRIATHAD
jgi:hypothetical protein